MMRRIVPFALALVRLRSPLAPSPCSAEEPPMLEAKPWPPASCRRSRERLPRTPLVVDIRATELDARGATAATCEC